MKSKKNQEVKNNSIQEIKPALMHVNLKLNKTITINENVSDNINEITYVKNRVKFDFITEKNIFLSGINALNESILRFNLKQKKAKKPEIGLFTIKEESLKTDNFYTLMQLQFEYNGLNTSLLKTLFSNTYNQLINSSELDISVSIKKGKKTYSMIEKSLLNSKEFFQVKIKDINIFRLKFTGVKIQKTIIENEKISNILPMFENEITEISVCNNNKIEPITFSYIPIQK